MRGTRARSDAGKTRREDSGRVDPDCRFDTEAVFFRATFRRGVRPRSVASSAAMVIATLLVQIHQFGGVVVRHHSVVRTEWSGRGSRWMDVDGAEVLFNTAEDRK